MQFSSSAQTRSAVLYQASHVYSFMELYIGNSYIHIYCSSYAECSTLAIMSVYSVMKQRLRRSCGGLLN